MVNFKLGNVKWNVKSELCLTLVSCWSVHFPHFAFCPDTRLCFLAGKSHPALLRGWLREPGYPICNDSPLFATIRDCSPLFALFETIHTICTIRYSLFGTIRYSRLIAIRVFQTPEIYLFINWFLILSQNWYLALRGKRNFKPWPVQFSVLLSHTIYRKTT